MAYGDFTVPRVLTDFGLTLRTDLDLFGNIPPVPPDPSVTALLDRQRGLALAINTEKARSELLIAPILGEVWRLGRGRVALFSGVSFPVDAEASLTGVCDYILGHPPQLDYVSAPVMMITEAKNESVMGGLGQCAAAMVAAQRFNRGRNPDVTTIHGCVTSGADWKFLRLRDALLEIDVHDYATHEADRILGIILHFVGLAPLRAAA